MRRRGHDDAADLSRLLAEADTLADRLTAVLAEMHTVLEPPRTNVSPPEGPPK